jgi:phosphatidate cytidylyltransferase
VHGRRVLSALVLIALFLLVIAFGGEAGFALMGMGIAAIGLWEFTRLLDHLANLPRALVLLGAVALVGATYAGGVEWFAIGVVLFVLLLLSWVVGGRGEMEVNLRQTALCLLGVLYLAGPLSLAVGLRGLPGGERYILLACGIVWIGDTGAFYIGSSLGRHRLAPQVSPKKSVEGSVGGLIGSMVAAWVLARVLGIPLTGLSSLLLGAVVGTAGQVGDLTESAIKRAFQVKDTGHLIPGHGGMLDRIDSLLFAIPVLYLWIQAGWI